MVLAVPARLAGSLLEPTSQDLAQDLKEIPYASVSNIYLGYPKDKAQASLSGFGYLLDRRDASTMLGAIYCSSVFPACAPDDRILIRVMAGGTLWPSLNEESNEALVQQADAMLRLYTGLSAPRVFDYVQHAPAAIPQYVHGHRSRVARIRSQVTALPNLQLLGNSFDAVSIVGQLKASAAP
jgi:oxygen-dependent protoporphyrinogen oxidase